MCWPFFAQLTALEDEVTTSLHDLMACNRIFGRPLSMDEFLEPAEEQEVGDCVFEGGDKEIVAAVNWEMAEKRGEVIEVESDEEEDVEPEVSHAETLALCQRLERACLQFGNADSTLPLELLKQIQNHPPIKILEWELKKSEYRVNTDTHIKFVQDHLPQKIDGQKCVPFIYADHESLKGSWLAPMLLELLAAHVRCCGTSFQVFGKPVGALGVCAAAVHCILFLYKDGDSAKEAAKEAKCTGLPSQPTKNVSFDAAWGSVTMQYSLQTAQLPNKKWDQIVNGMWELVGEDCLAHCGHVALDDDSMDVHDAILLSDNDEADS
ncbi:hypothetical protein BDR07DRAFT_1500795 [Suillus spraguei]|nr:hypothetical protein BDR07DRAFT_1500795 [Suillus spraguei]